jgi:hypothetical protein
MINGIKPLPPKQDFDNAVDKLVLGIKENYLRWCNGRKISEDEMIIKPGRKFVKIIRGSSVWGFVSKVDGFHKGLPLKVGDVMMAAGWSAPAKHTRGNIFDDNQNYFQWTGPNYR